MSALATLTEARPARKVRMFKHTCRECGDAFTNVSPDAEFCTAAHRADFNNRRRLRGAELYDMFMAIRYERDRAKELQLWRAMCRMAAGFRDEDQRQRAGRKSWRNPLSVLNQRFYLNATTLAKRRPPPKG